MTDSPRVRPFDWRDIPTLHRYRHDSVFLDSALVLTRGSQLMSRALLSYLAPGTGVVTGVADGGAGCSAPLVGQARHMLGSQYAHLTFLAPDTALEAPSSDGISPTLSALLNLLDYLVIISAEQGALRLLADVDEHTPAFEALRQSGFAIYTRQRIWQVTGQLPDRTKSPGWKVATSNDMIAIRSLYNNLVPGLVQQAEPSEYQHPHGMVYYQNSTLLAYVEFRYGPQGIWAQPFVHPDAEHVRDRLADLLRRTPNRSTRPVYVCVRSYQSWLEPALEDLDALASPRQAVMVKHMAVQQKVTRSFALPALDGGQPEISAPITRSESK